MKLNRGTLLSDFEGNEFVLEKSVDAEVIKKSDDTLVVSLLGQNFCLSYEVYVNQDKIGGEIEFLKSNVNEFSEADEKFFLSAGHFAGSKIRKGAADKVGSLIFLDSVLTASFDSDEELLLKAQCLEKFNQGKPLFSQEKAMLSDFYLDLANGIAIELPKVIEKSYLNDKILALSSVYMVKSGLLGVVTSDDIIKSLNDAPMSVKTDLKKAKETVLKFAEGFSNFIRSEELSKENWEQLIKGKRDVANLTKVKIADKNGHSVYRWVKKGEEPKGAKKVNGKPKKEKETTTEPEYNYKKYTKDNLEIPRERMPQIHGADTEAYLEHFEKKGIKVVRTKMKVNRIKIAQAEINEDKLLTRLKNKAPWKDKIFLISADKYLIDGNHTWAQAVEEDEKANVNVAKIFLPIKKLIANSNKMKIVENKDMDDKLTKAEQDMLYRLQSFDENSIDLAKKLKRQVDFEVMSPKIKTAINDIISFC